MEGDLKMQGAKNERLVFLFDKMILISKRREDGFIMYKTHIMVSLVCCYYDVLKSTRQT